MSTFRPSPASHTPRRLPTCLRSLLALLCLLAALPPAVVARPRLAQAALPGQTAQVAQLHVLDTQPNHLDVEFVAGDVTVEPVTLDGQTYPRVRIAGTEMDATPGAPQAPTLGAMLGVPSVAGITLTILAADYDTLPDSRLPTNPIPSPTAPEPASLPPTWLDGPAAFHPSSFLLHPSLVVLAGSGYLADQPFAQLHFYPVQPDAADDTLRVYRRIVARLTWQPTPTAAASARATNPHYEPVLAANLLNYADLARPQPASSISVPAAPATLLTAATDAAVAADPPRLKLTIEHDGLYRLTYADLLAAGFDLTGIDPRDLRVSNRGQTVPILVNGESDGVFDPADSLLFYATALDTVYTGSNVYWLEAGPGAGLRMATHAGSVAGAVQPAANFPITRHAEENTIYWRGMPAGSGQDHYFWDNRLSPGASGLPTSRTYTVTLDHVATGITEMGITEAQVRVRLKGYTSLAHRTRITLNGTMLDERAWAGQVDFTHAITAPHPLLQNGDNLLTVEALDAGAAVDQILVNWIEIAYRATYAAAGGALHFAPPAAGAWQYTVTGLPSADALAFDITDPAAPKRITPVQVIPSGGSFTLSFQAQGNPATRYLAVAPAAFRTPARLTLDQPSHWQAASNAADYIIITHPDFYSETLTLAAHRQADGLAVAVVKVDDLYDEFSAGIFTPQAIRDFLAYAYHHWQSPAPAYVLLVGDAVIDYRDFTKTGAVNYVPTQLVETAEFGQTASDNWFAAVSGDDLLPDLHIGRLSVTSAQQAAGVIAKLIAYDETPPSPQWNRAALFVADDDDPDFTALVDHLAARLPFDYTVNKLAAAGYPPGDLTADIASQVRAGNVLVTYAGHGEFFRWGKWNHESSFILSLADIAALDNAGRLPFVVVANCANGFFAGPQQELAVAEAFQRQPNGGALAIWASSGLGAPAAHRALLTGLYDAIYQNDLLAIGAAATAAKVKLMAQGAYWQELVATYILFGDPYTHLGLAPNPPYVAAVTPAPGATEVPIDQPLIVEFSKPVAPDAVTLTGDLLPALLPAWNASHTRAVFTHAGLTHGAQLTLQLAAQDQQGSPLRADGPLASPWAFTVTTDATPPTGSLNLEEDEAGNTMLRLRFSEPVRPESITLAITPPTAGELIWDSDTDALFTPATGFIAGQTYAVSVTAALDRAGNPLASPFASTITGDTPSGVYLPYLGR